jgi:hypothetical protein
MAYAQRTSVPVDQSRREIEQTMARYGADSFAYMTNPEGATIGFRVQGRVVRITIPKAEGRNADQENRRRWRALLLVIKAKLEAVATGIATFEDEFLPYTVMPNGQTVAEWAHPQLKEMELGKMPLALPAGSQA